MIKKVLKLNKKYCWQPTWWDDFKYKLKIKRANFIFGVYNKIPFLEWLLCSLCELEMSFILMLDQEFKKELDTCGIVNANTGKCDWQENIPKNTLYCDDCLYRSYSKLADFFFGMSGYCYWLGKGDFSYVSPTELLWDGCKECGISYFEGDDS